MTLLELLVVLIIIAILASVAVPHGPIRSPLAPRGDSTATLVAAARRQAIQTRRPITMALTTNGSVRMATAFPDGTVAADSTLGISPFDGTAHEGP